MASLRACLTLSFFLKFVFGIVSEFSGRVDSSGSVIPLLVLKISPSIFFGTEWRRREVEKLRIPVVRYDPHNIIKVG